MTGINMLNKPNQWECFSDPSYFDKWAVRNVNNKEFTSAIHVNTKEEAEFIRDKFNALDALMARLESKELALDVIRGGS